jgi:hypothetical protein
MHKVFISYSISNEAQLNDPKPKKSSKKDHLEGEPQNPIFVKKMQTKMKKQRKTQHSPLTFSMQALPIK